MQTFNRYTTALTCILLLNNGFAQLSGDSFKMASQNKSAKFYYVYDGVNGFANKKEDGQVSGLLVDIMKEFESYVEQKEGIKITTEFKYSKDGEFETFMSDVRNSSGGVFGLSNISINEERMKTYSFSSPYLENVSVLLSNAKIPTLQKLNDISVSFEGMTAYTLPSSTYHKRLLKIKNDHFANMKIIELSSTAPLMEQLITDDKAFAILDLNYYLEVLQKKLPIKRHPIGDRKDDQFGVIMPKDCDWQPLLNDFLADFIGSASYGKIVSRNLGSSALRLINSVSRN